MEEILKSGYVCHPQQLYTLRRVTVAEGKARGMDIIEACTAAAYRWIFCRIWAWISGRCAIRV